MKKIISLFLICIMVTSALLGCAAPAPAANEEPAAAPAQEEQVTGADIDFSNQGKVASADENEWPFPFEEGGNYDADLVVTQSQDMISFDPIATATEYNASVLFTLYSRLFKSDPNYRPVPELCEEYSSVSDNEWHFKIHEGVKFHDGTELTADDVVYCLNRAASGNTLGALFKPVKEITKVDDYTISVTTTENYPGLLTAFTHVACSIIPKDYCEQCIANNDWTKPIGSGQYKFVSRIPGDSVKVERFDDFFLPEWRAKNKSITFKIIPEGTSRTIAVETGTADLNMDFETIDYDRVMANPDVKLWEAPSTYLYFLAYDTTLPWFDNKLVRQAINFAVDRQALLEVGVNGKGSVLYNQIGFAPGVLGAVNNPGDYYSYDVEKAKALMAEAGCTGFETEIYCYMDAAERIATMIQAYLAEIGIKATVNRVEDATFYAKSLEHAAPMMVDTWVCYWDADLWINRRFQEAGFGGVNRSWYTNPELDALIAEGRSYNDNAKREEVYAKVQELAVEEAPECDLFGMLAFALSRADLKGVILGSEKCSFLDQLHY